MSIIDKRQGTKSYKSAGNRKKFIDRYKQAIKKKVQDSAHKGGITGVGTKRNVSVNKKDLTEPSFRKDRSQGNKTRVLPGNKIFRKGEQVRRPPPQGGQGSGPGGGPDSKDELDQFQFTLTKEEFLELYFGDMALPNYVKEVLLQDSKKKFKRAGYTKQGVPARLDLKKTFEQAIARKIATKAGGKKPRFLDDIDLRYRMYTPQPVPNRQAVVFCIMDTSGSMSQMHKDLAKRFYILLYLFLEKEYKAVEIVFIRHTHTASEVDEETFFNDRMSGGTVVSTALELMREIMDERYSPSEWNIYACQASDGDVWTGEDDNLAALLESLLVDVQYYAYIQIEREEPSRVTGLADMFEPLAEKYAHMNIALVWDESHIYPVFRELFKKESDNV